MAATAIYASRILTPHEEILDSVIVVEDGKITRIRVAFDPRGIVRGS